MRLLELVTKVRNPVTGEDEEFTIAEQLDMQIIAKARKGDLKAYEILLDRLEGRPKQTTDITADIKGNVQITIEPDAIYRLIEKDVPLCLTPYPVKGYGANNQLQFIVHFPDKDNVRIQKDGFAEITAGPTGFMMIKREVFEKLAKEYPERKTVNKQLVGNKVETMEKGWYTFFETAQDPENGYLGEDIAFCRLWTNIGGKIYADTQTPLTHFGSHAFHGSLSTMFSKPKPIDDKPKE